MTMPIIMIIGVVFFLLIALIAVFITKYRTAGPDEALIVTGSYLGNKNVHVDEGGNRIKIVRGGGTFVLPVFQQTKHGEERWGPMKKTVIICIYIFLLLSGALVGLAKEETAQKSENQPVVIPDQAIRLRILANSDSDQDQQ